MPRLDGADGDPGSHARRFVAAKRLVEGLQPFHVRLLVERIQQGLSHSLPAAVLPLDVRPLQVGRVSQDQVGEVDRGRRRVNRPGVARLGEERQPAGMVEVGVGQHDRVELLEGAFLRDTVIVFNVACALEQSQVHQAVGIAGLHQVRGPRDLAAPRTVHRDLHCVNPSVLVAAVRLSVNHFPDSHGRCLGRRNRDGRAVEGP